MSPADTLWSALTALWVNKLRSSLTILGIVIGVAAVISLMSIGRGAQAAITEDIQSLGANQLIVQPGAATEGPRFLGQGTGSTLTLDDAYAMMDPVWVPSAAAVAPELSTGGQIVAGRANTFSQVLGVTPEYELAQEVTLSYGDFITAGHIANRSEVVVLGSRVSESLFGLRDPVGQTVKINERQFTVIGVMARNETGVWAGVFGETALVPITTAYYRLAVERTTQGSVSVDRINVQVKSPDLVDDAEREITNLLRLRHRLTGGNDFYINNFQDIIDSFEDATNTFVIFLGSIAGISLLVGGIGIMNIMLVSVAERTREIGIRKALGAKRKDILVQFMGEATLLSLVGGGIGVLVGVGISRLADGWSLAGETLNTTFNLDIVLLALAVSAVVGIFFGIYPAMRAARLRPIDALRYE